MMKMRIFVIKIMPMLIGFIFTINLMGQVTIGSGLTPAKGAILDLKEREDGTSSKGLLLPRVSLDNLDELTPLLTTDEAQNEENKLNLAGVIVYNTMRELKNECDFKAQKIIEPGLYVWNGKEWIPIGKEVDDIIPNKSSIVIKNKKDVHLLKDTRGGVDEYYTYRQFGSAGTWLTMNIRATRYSDDHENTSLRGRIIRRGGGTGAGSGAVSKGANYVFPGEYGSKAYDDSWFKENRLAGLAYSYEAVIGYNGVNDLSPSKIRQGICPTGWHVPKYAEYEALKKQIQENPQKYMTPNPDGSYPPADEINFSKAFVVPCTPWTKNFPGTLYLTGRALSYSDGGFGDFGLGTVFYDNRINHSKDSQIYWFDEGAKKNGGDSGAGEAKCLFLQAITNKPVEQEEVRKYNTALALGIRCVKNK